MGNLQKIADAANVGKVSDRVTYVAHALGKAIFQQIAKGNKNFEHDLILQST